MHINKDFYQKWHPFLIKELSLFLKREAQIEGGKRNHLSQLRAAFLSVPSRLNCTATDCFAFKGHAICCWRYCEYVKCLWNLNTFSTPARWSVQENDNLMLKIYCLGEHKVCQVGEAFHEQYWIPFEALTPPLPPHLFASPYDSELSIDSRSLCVLWTPSRSLKESHKKTFYLGPVALMGLSLCTMH